jgi:DNA-binding PadR family transcriptional regulator
MSSDRDLPPPLVLLGLLVPGPQHPYALYADFNAGLGRIWRLGRSQFYALWHRLRAAGLVDAEVEPQRNRPDRQVLSLTPGGELAFRRWLGDPTPTLGRMRFDIPARLYWFERLDLPGRADFLARQQEEIATRLVILRRALLDADALDRLTLSFRLSQLTAVAAWLREFEKNPPPPHEAPK